MILTMWVGYAVFLGAVLASFACVVSERRAAGRSWAAGRSTCACGRALRPWENIPVAGWLATGGVARCCGARLPKWYLFAELGGAGAGGGLGVAGWSLTSSVGAPVAAVVVTAGFVALLGALILLTRGSASR